MRDEARAQFALGIERNQWVTTQAEAWARSEAQQARRREELVVSRAESEISAILESEEASRRRSDALTGSLAAELRETQEEMAELRIENEQSNRDMFEDRQVIVEQLAQTSFE